MTEIENLINKWDSERLTADANSILLEAEPAYYAGSADAIAGCIEDLRKLIARNRLQIV